MKVFVGDDGRIRIRIGHENLGSASLGRWYDGKGGIRLLQYYNTTFWGYILDPDGHRGTTNLPDFEFYRIKEQLPSAKLTIHANGSSVDIAISDADLAMLLSSATQLSTRLVRFSDTLTVVFGDFSLWIANFPGLHLFHLEDNRFMAFWRGPPREGDKFSALREGDMEVIIAHLGSARLLQDGDRTLVELCDDDVAMLLGMATEWDRSVETVHWRKPLGS